MLIVLTTVVFVSCKKVYKIGDIGPAGGYIFYDCDADNNSGNADGLKSSKCGWRYLEAAPADIRVLNGVPTVDSTKTDQLKDMADIVGFIPRFGIYRKSSDGSSLYVNGKASYSSSDCTGTEIGTGKKNTDLLVKAMGDSAYQLNKGTETTSIYAAKLCSDLKYNGFEDWFLPSRDELNLLYVNLHNANLGDFEDGRENTYWSSSESSSDIKSVWVQSFVRGEQDGRARQSRYKVRAVRAF